MKKHGFTLIELLAVIVILAIIALIATPIVLNIIDDTKKSAQLRSAEMYLSGVETAVMKESMKNNTTLKLTTCDITTDGNLACENIDNNIEVEVDGEVPSSGSITFENGKITEVTLGYENTTIVMDADNKLKHDEVALN